MDSSEPAVETVAVSGCNAEACLTDHLESLTLDSEGSSSPKNTPVKDESNVCAICHDGIILQEMGFIKGCEHVYCVNCILQWASYKSYPWCPQCRLPFESLYLYKALDGSLSDFMLEESVCLLLRASWYKPVEFDFSIEAEPRIDIEDYEEDDDDYYRNTLRIGNRRWGENGYVRQGRMEARPAPVRQPASAQKPQGNGMGRRAKRAQKRGTTADGAGASSGAQSTSAGR